MPAASGTGAMTHEALSASAQDYLKVLWTLSEWSDEPIVTKQLAEKLGVKPPAVSESVRRLAEQGFVHHEPYGAVSLTEQGRGAALAMVRRHRLLETFLVRELGFGWDEVHDEAEVLEHAVSDQLIDRIDAKLGHPTRDPHGDPIPRPGGEIELPPARRLIEMQPGQTSVVERISDSDPEMLRFVGSIGIAVGSPLRLVDRHDYAGMLVVETASGTPRHLGTVVAQSIWVAPETDAPG